MLKKVFTLTLTLAVMICFGGCAEDKASVSPDKAILAYAELIMTGDSVNAADTGFAKEGIKDVGKDMAKDFADSFGSFVPVSQKSADEIAKTIRQTFKEKIKFQTKLKTDDAEHPVVELTTTPLDMKKAETTLASNDKMIALAGMVGHLKSDGATDEQLLNNEEVQNLIVVAVGKYIEDIPVQSEKTLDVSCEKVTGSDGRMTWVPANVEEVISFIMQKK